MADLQTETPDVPDWVISTPSVVHPYHLILEGPEEWIEDIELSRSEYINLKLQLARMRGITVPLTAEA